MKSLKDIEKLSQKYLKEEQKSLNKLIKFNKEFEKENDLAKKLSISLEKIVPEAIKGIMLMDKANILGWVMIENPDKELMQFDEIRAKYEHLKYLGKKAIEPVGKNWNILNFQLRLISSQIENLMKIIQNQQQRINELNKIINTIKK